MNPLEHASGISSEALNPPYGGKLIDLIATDGRAAELKLFSATWPSWTLTPRQLCDLELLITGGFSPLRGFMTRSEYDAVCHSMRLQNGVVWPIPIVLDVTEETARALGPGGTLALRDAEIGLGRAWSTSWVQVFVIYTVMPNVEPGDKRRQVATQPIEISVVPDAGRCAPRSVTSPDRLSTIGRSLDVANASKASDA